MTVLADSPRVPAYHVSPRTGSGTVPVFIHTVMNAEGALALVRSNIDGVTVAYADSVYTITIPTVKDLWGLSVGYVDKAAIPLIKTSVSSASTTEIVVKTMAILDENDAAAEILTAGSEGDELFVTFWGEW